MEANIQRFFKLFLGYERAYGVYKAGFASEDGKLGGRVRTVHKPLTPNQINDHFSSSDEITAVVPLLEDNSCHHGLIDIDIKGEAPLRHTIARIDEMVREFRMPLVACESKSGGVHLYLFCIEGMAAMDMVEHLTRYAASLGYSGVEIFPKQINRVDQEEVGSFHNMPYFNVAEEKARCFHNGKFLSLEEFLDHAEKMAVPAEMAITEEKTMEGFSDAPPCLQTLTAQQFPEGGRNKGLFNVALFLKKKHPDNWQEELHKFNYKQLRDPLPDTEIKGIVASLVKKEYHYSCRDAPICNHCDRKACLKVKFGIGDGNTSKILVLDSITKHQTPDMAAVRWVIEIDSHRVAVSTEELLDQRRLQRKVFEVVNEVFVLVKAEEWNQSINDLMANVEVIIDPFDASEKGQFRFHMETFLYGPMRASGIDELKAGKIFFDEEHRRLVFRSSDLIKYLQNQRFNYRTPNQVWQWMRSFGAEQEQRSINGKNTKVWSVAALDGYEAENTLAIPTANNLDMDGGF